MERAVSGVPARATRRKQRLDGKEYRKNHD